MYGLTSMPTRCKTLIMVGLKRLVSDCMQGRRVVNNLSIGMQATDERFNDNGRPLARISTFSI
jgi:hypothetical protein